MGPSLQVLLLSVVEEGGDAGEPANSSWEQNRLEFAFRWPKCPEAQRLGSSNCTKKNRMTPGKEARE